MTIATSAMLLLTCFTRTIATSLNAVNVLRTATSSNNQSALLSAFLDASSSGSCSPDSLVMARINGTAMRFPHYSTDHHVVPPNLLFNAKHNLLNDASRTDGADELLFGNINHTISLHSSFRVVFHDDTQCMGLFELADGIPSAELRSWYEHSGKPPPRAQPL